MTRLRRLVGQMALSPANRRNVMAPCFQSVAMFGSELWWKGDHVRGTMGQADEQQLLVNQEARATTGCFGTTNLGALSMESGLRVAATQLENRQRRFGLRLLSLPQGDQAREIVGAPTEIGRRLTNALAGWKAQFCVRSLKLSTRSCCKRRKRRRRQRRRRRDRGSPCSRTGPRWTKEPPDTRWCGNTAEPGRASTRPTWATTRRPTMQSAPLSQGCWKRPGEDRPRQSGSRSSRTRRQPSEGWPLTNPVPASCTRCRPGSTSRRCGERSQTSPSRSDGARRTNGAPRTRVSPAMRRPMSGRRSQRRSQTPVGWNG